MQLLDSAVELRGSQVLNVKRYKNIVWLRRCMAAITFLAIAAAVLFVIALLSPGWTLIEFTNTDLENVRVQLGVWGEWREITNHSQKRIEWIPHFPSPPESVLRLADADLKHYYRSQMVIGIIAMILMIFNNSLATYTFCHHRYVYKRLVACLHVVIAMCVVVVIEVLSNSVNEWDLQVAEQSKNTDWNYSVAQKTGRPSQMAYSCVIIYLLAAVIFAFGSHKHKGSRAATVEFEIEDRPVHIGR